MDGARTSRARLTNGRPGSPGCGATEALRVSGVESLGRSSVRSSGRPSTVIEDDFDGNDVADGGRSDKEEMKRLKDMAKAIKENPLRTRYAPHRRGPASRHAVVKHEPLQRSLTRSASVAVTNTAKEAAHRTRLEFKILKGTAMAVAKNSINMMSQEGADQVQCEFMSQLHGRRKRKEASAVSSADTQVREDLLKLYTETAREKCGAPSVAALPTGQDWYVCGAALRSQTFIKSAIPFDFEPSDQLSDEQIMKLRLQFHGDSNREHFNDANPKPEVAKAVVKVQDIQELTRQAQGGTRRALADHEAAFDFGQRRVYMPRWLRGNCAGQLVAVDADVGSDGVIGEVTMCTKVPQRVCFTAAPPLLEEIVDIAKLRRASEALYAPDEGPISPAVAYQGHMHMPRKPSSNAEWGQRGAALRAKGNQKEEDVQRRGSKQSSSGAVTSDELRARLESELYQSSSDDEKAWASPTSARGKQSPRGQKDQPASARGNQLEDRQREEASLPTPWDARRPPAPDELRALLDRAKFVMPATVGVVEDHFMDQLHKSSSFACSPRQGQGSGTQSQRSGLQSGVSGRRRASGRSSPAGASDTLLTDATSRNSARRSSDLSQGSNSPAGKNNVWSLRLVDGDASSFRLDIRLAAAAQDKQAAVEEHEDDPIWQDIFQPVSVAAPQVGRSRRVRCCGC